MMSDYVTINAVAEKFNVSVSTIRQWIRKDNIPRSTYIKVGNTYRFKLDEIEKSLTGETKSDTTQKWQDTLAEKEDTLELNLDDDI
jgi:excisionase family DNA binding protein